MTGRLLATALLVLTAAGLLACAPRALNSAPSATIEPTATAKPAVATPTSVPTAFPTLTPTDTPAPSPTPSPIATDAQTPTAATGSAGLLRLTDNLDDPQGYCVDVAGFGANIRLDAPLQAHTCKPGSDDQLFATGDNDGRGFRLVEYHLCLAAAMEEPNAEVIVAACDSGMVGQPFLLNNEGRVYLDREYGPTLCLGVAPGSGEPAGGRNHLRRDLALYDCEHTDPALITWEMVNP